MLKFQSLLVFWFASLHILGAGGKAEVNLISKQIGLSNSIEVIVFDPKRKEDFLYVTARKSHYEPDKKSYFLGSPIHIRLEKTEKEGVYKAKQDFYEVTHSTLILFEYLYNHWAQHHNDHSMVIHSKTEFAFH